MFVWPVKLGCEPERESTASGAPFLIHTFYSTTEKRVRYPTNLSIWKLQTTCDVRAQMKTKDLSNQNNCNLQDAAAWIGCDGIRISATPVDRGAIISGTCPLPDQ
jgi:hypothetical protein